MANEMSGPSKSKTTIGGNFENMKFLFYFCTIFSGNSTEYISHFNLRSKNL